VLKLKDCEDSCIETLRMFTAGRQGQIMLEQPDCLPDKMTGSADERRAVEVIYLDFGKAFDTNSHSVLIWYLRTPWLPNLTAMWVENCLGCQAQRAVISG